MNQSAPPTHHWDHIFFLHRPSGGVGALVFLWLLIWFGREAAAGWKDIDLGWQPWMYYFVLWATGAALGWVGAERRTAGAVAGGLVGVGGLFAVGGVRVVTSNAPDGVYAAAMAVGMLPGFVAYRSIDQGIRNFLGEAVPSPFPTLKTMPDVLVTDGPTKSLRPGLTSASLDVITDPAMLLGRIEPDLLSELGPLTKPRPRPGADGPGALPVVGCQGLAAVVLGAVPLLMAAPSMLLAYTLHANHYAGFRDGDRRVAAYAGYLFAFSVTVLAGTGLQSGMRCLRGAADAGGPDPLSEAGVYLCLLAVAVWIGCGLAWHAQAWPLLKP